MGLRGPDGRAANSRRFRARQATIATLSSRPRSLTTLRSRTVTQRVRKDRTRLPLWWTQRAIPQVLFRWTITGTARTITATGRTNQAGIPSVTQTHQAMLLRTRGTRIAV